MKNPHIGKPLLNAWNSLCRASSTGRILNNFCFLNDDYYQSTDELPEPRGLKNFHNTCYFNSILQCLARTPNLLQLYKNIENSKEEEELENSLTFEFSKVIEELVWSGVREPLNPLKLYNEFIKKVPYFAGNEQQDCHDFLKSLFNIFDEEKLINTEKIFGGVIKRSLECQTCKNVSIADERFQDLSLPITNKKGCLLTECLDTINVEYLSDSEQVVCDACTEQCGNGKSVFRDFKIERQVSETPAVLVLCLKRYQYRNNCIIKNNAFVDFPNILDFTPYCCNTDEKMSDNKVLYELYGVVEHRGRYGFGHYTSYVKVKAPPVPPNADNIEEFDEDETNDDISDILDDELIENISLPEVQSDEWFYINDHRVTSVSIERVLETQASLLFYERIF